MVRRLLGLMINDAIQATGQRIEERSVASVAKIQSLPENVVAHTETMMEMIRGLKAFLFENLYRHPRVMRMERKAVRIITALFEAYTEEPRQLPYTEQAKLDERSLHRVVCDYIAGMTDRYALQEYAKLFDPMERV
jgi:dGTPase